MTMRMMIPIMVVVVMMVVVAVLSMLVQVMGMGIMLMILMSRFYYDSPPPPPLIDTSALEEGRGGHTCQEDQAPAMPPKVPCEGAEKRRLMAMIRGIELIGTDVRCRSFSELGR